MYVAAILRTNESLNLDTVLREAVDAARGLTEARLGMIATVDEAGATDGFVESGFTPAEAAELASWPDRECLFEHLRGLSGTLRVADLATYVQDLGLSPTPALSRAFQGTPMHCRGADVGSFFLAESVIWINTPVWPCWLHTTMWSRVSGAARMKWTTSLPPVGLASFPGLTI